MLSNTSNCIQAKADRGGFETYLIQQQPCVIDDHPQWLGARPDKISPYLLHNLPKMFLQQEGTQLYFRLSHLDGRLKHPAVLWKSADVIMTVTGEQEGGGHAAAVQGNPSALRPKMDVWWETKSRVKPAPGAVAGVRQIGDRRSGTWLVPVSSSGG